MPFVTLATGKIEYEPYGGADAQEPPIVMLHEGLGSVSTWRSFPRELSGVTGKRVLAYSRYGYGRSERLQAPRTVRYMHDEALIVLPQLLDHLGIDNPILLGHSDGASIALIHAGGTQRHVAGIVALAPHIMVEDVSVASIEAAGDAYQGTDLRTRLARYHEDVDGAFWGWNKIWLHPRFRSWSIEEYLPRIACPILAIQGQEDEYGSMEQIERIARSAPDVELLRLKECRHSPHRDQREKVLRAVRDWISRRIPTGSQNSLDGIEFSPLPRHASDGH